MAGSASAQKLDDLILEKENDWTMSAEEFEKKYMAKKKDEVKTDGKGSITIKMGKNSSFEWVSKAKQTARLTRLAGEANLDPAFAEKFLKFVIEEVIRHHEREKVAHASGA